jgi:hypothetical protein
VTKFTYAEGRGALWPRPHLPTTTWSAHFKLPLSSTDINTVPDHTSFSRWDIINHGVPQGSILGPLLFLCCINDLPRIFNNGVKSVLFADDKSLIISNYNYLEYRNNISTAFVQLN